jgi:signal transduction histidine kinase
MLLEEGAEELYEHAPCGYVSTAPDGMIVRVNQTLLTWTGRSRGELVERSRFQDLLSIPSRMYYETHWAPLLRMQGFVSEVAFEMICGERSALPVLVSAVQKRNEAGEPLFNRITVFNATDRRKYERELLVQRRRAERADRAKADLLAMIGHDMRTPLNTIGGVVQLLERLSPTEQQSKYLRMLRSSSAALLSLANQILDFSRIEAGQVTVAEGAVDVRALVRDTADALSAAAEQKKIELRTEVDAKVPAALWGDGPKIQQILTNLATNAVKFTHRGGVTVWAHAPEVDAQSALVVFEVADTGIGIAPDRLEAVFEEFTQADETIGEHYGGTGLGLTISRRLASLMRGKLAVQSELGRGSTFSLELRLRLA